MEPRPDSKPFRDLERRVIYIPKGFIKGWMMDMPWSGAEYGRYGRSRYGRCVYGGGYGIYGYDRYGSCRYS